MDLVRTALHHADRGQAAGDDRYLVHLVTRTDTPGNDHHRRPTPAPRPGRRGGLRHRHHRLLHHGYRLEGDPNHQLRFYRPDGTYLGATYPATTPQPAGV
jgi:hypothetical protein